MKFKINITIWTSQCALQTTVSWLFQLQMYLTDLLLPCLTTIARASINVRGSLAQWSMYECWTARFEQNCCDFLDYRSTVPNPLLRKVIQVSAITCTCFAQNGCREEENRFTEKNDARLSLSPCSRCESKEADISQKLKRCQTHTTLCECKKWTRTSLIDGATEALNRQVSNKHNF